MLYVPRVHSAAVNTVCKPSSQSRFLAPTGHRFRRNTRNALLLVRSADGKASSSDSEQNHNNSQKDEDSLEKLIFLNNGDAVSLSQRSRKYVRPTLDLSKEEVVAVQLQALAMNHVPYRDQGIEVLYRFASFDPFTRSNYFGRNLDLGQFERFRRIMHSPPFAMLLGHETSQVLSALEVSERMWKQRVLVIGPAHGGQRDEGVFEFTLSQRLGGCYDGYWFTESLIADSTEDGP